MLRNETSSLSDLVTQVRRFLESDKPAMKAVRDEILYDLQKLGHVYVIGGLIRDLALYGINTRPSSDLDLVVRCSKNKLSEFAERLGAIPNRFGGFGIRSRAYRVDFWAFSNTWAKTAGLTHLREPSDLCKTTFFDWDAVIYGVAENRIWAIERYLDRIHSGRISINLKGESKRTRFFGENSAENNDVGCAPKRRPPSLYRRDNCAV